MRQPTTGLSATGAGLSHKRCRSRILSLPRFTLFRRAARGSVPWWHQMQCRPANACSGQGQRSHSWGRKDGSAAANSPMSLMTVSSRTRALPASGFRTWKTSRLIALDSQDVSWWSGEAPKGAVKKPTSGEEGDNACSPCGLSRSWTRRVAFGRLKWQRNAYW